MVHYYDHVDAAGRAEQVRRFNRFYTEAIGSLDDRHEGLPVNLAQSRMLFTLSSLAEPRVNDVARELRLDLGYTSRVLGALEDARLVRRQVSPSDRRERVVRLTPKGVRLLAEIERRSDARVLTMIDHLEDNQVGQLMDAMDTIRHLIARQEHHAEPG